MTVLFGKVRVDPAGGFTVEPAERDERFAVSAALRRAGIDSRLEEGRVRVGVRSAARLLDGVDGLELQWGVDAREAIEGRQLAEHGRTVVADVCRELAADGVSAARRMLIDVALLEGLDDHQIANVAAMTVPGGHGLCLFDEQGAGKTVSLIAAFDVLVQRDQVDFLLVLAPKAMLSEWQKDFVRFTRRLYKVGIYAGDDRERRAVLEARPDVLVTNYESAVSRERYLAAVLSAYGRRAVLCVDESYHVKNANASRSIAVRRLRNAVGRTFVLCGTPAPNRADDLVAQVGLVDFGITFETVDIPDDRHTAVPVVRDALEVVPVHRRNLKADVLPELPDRQFTRIPVELAAHQRRLYDDAARHMLADLRGVSEEQFDADRTTWAARRSAMLRLCSNPIGLQPDYTENPAKLEALDRLVQQYVIDADEKLVVWSFYTASLQAIVDRYRDVGLVRYDGQVTSVDERRTAILGFQEDPAVRIFVGNPAAAGAGITLHAARLAVYESLSNQAAHYLQSLDRIHRRGQDRPVEYFFLVAESTLEQAEYERLAQKHQAARDLLGDDDPLPLTRERLLIDLARGTTR